MIERRVRVVPDTDPIDPRDWGCIGRMICFHSRYNLGDDHHYDSDDWKEQLACEADDGLADRLDHVRNEVYDVLSDCAVADGGYGNSDAHDYAISKVNATCDKLVDWAFDAGYAALPLYLYDHSGITMNTGGFNCMWDSGCVGVIVCDNDTIYREYGGDKGMALRALKAEVKDYDNYLTGNIWTLIAEERDDDGEWDYVDSISGIDGDDVADAAKECFNDDFADCEVEYDYTG